MRLDSSFSVIMRFCYKNTLQKVTKLGHCEHLDRGLLRSFPGIVPDNYFCLDVVHMMHDGSRMMNKGVSTVIDSWLYTVYLYLCDNYQYSLLYST